MPKFVAKTNPPFLEITQVHKRFAGVHALRGVSLTIEAGEIYHLLGENGCGKSTLIKILSGAQPQDEGTVMIDGRSHTGLKPLQALAYGIETVYQDLSLIPNLSVAENIGLTEQLVASRGRLARLLDREKLLATTRSALEKVNLPSDVNFISTPVELLPIATRQLIAIARAIASKARLVIMDEPTTALTQREVDRLVAVVSTMRADNVAVLFVSHKLDECYAMGGQVIVMRDGSKVAQGPIADYSKTQLSHLMTGKTLGAERYRTSKPQADVMLRVTDLGRKNSFKNMSFDLHRGEIVGITGLLDSGRNELALTIAGISPATQGSMFLNGENVQLKSPSDAINLGIGYVPEDRLNEGLFLDKPIRDNVVAAILHRLKNRFGFFDSQAAVALAKQTIAKLQVATPDVERPVQSLSGGNQQRVLIGRWLTINPKLLILHGPTVGVDVGSKDTIYKIIQQLSQDGLSVILISDDLPELLQNCDRILLMKKGSMSHEFEASNLTEERLHEALLAGDSIDLPIQ